MIATSLPDRGDFALTGGLVITMDDALGSFQRGDVVISGGAITEVGDAVEVPRGYSVIDVSGHIVLPGFVDTHFHLWNTLLRGVIGPGEGRSYFPVKRRLAPLFEPRHSYVAARLALAEALNGGMTTVVNWNHNLKSPDDADANLNAQLESGLRTRLAYGNPDAFDPSKKFDYRDIERVANRIADEGDHRLDLGVSLRGPTRTDPDVMQFEWGFARERGLPITLHVGGRRTDVGRYADIVAMHDGGFLGSDVQLVHAVDVNDHELALMAESDTSLTLSPVTEFKTMGLPPLGPTLERGIRTSLSIDTLAAPTNADMFGVMKLMLRMEQFRDPSSQLDESVMVRMATIDGARDLGIDDVTGSITPGKRADVIAVDATGPSMSPGVDPLALLVHCAQPTDVSTVICDGRLLKRARSITFFDSREVAAAATSATADLLNTAGWELERAP